MSKNVRYKMLRNLDLCFMPGVSRHATKKENNGKSPYIHSYTTFYQYIAIVKRFAAWLDAQGLSHCTLEVAIAMVGAFLAQYTNASTCKTYRSALAKALGVNGIDLCETPVRRRKEFTRGRVLTNRAKTVERNHAQLMEILRSIGLRKNRELKRVTAKNFHLGNPKRGQNPNLWYCRVKGKGGRWRDCMVIPGPGADALIARILATPTGPLFPDIPSGANVHMCRADYAARCYDYALTYGFGDGKIYGVRDGTGRCYDRGALDWVAAQLGHGRHRYVDVVYSYLSYGQANRETV